MSSMLMARTCVLYTYERRSIACEMLEFICSSCREDLGKRTEKWLIFDAEKRIKAFRAQVKQTKSDFEKQLKEQKNLVEMQIENVQEVQLRLTRQIQSNSPTSK